MVCVCRIHSCSSNVLSQYLPLCLSLILPYTTSEQGEGPPPLTCPPSLHSGTVVMPPFSSKKSPSLRGSSNTHHGDDQKLKKIHTQIPEGHQCPCNGNFRYLALLRHNITLCSVDNQQDANYIHVTCYPGRMLLTYSSHCLCLIAYSMQ